MKEQPFTGHWQDTSVVVTINHCYQYRSWKEGETQDSNKGRQEREEGRRGKEMQNPDEDEGHQTSGLTQMTLSREPNIWTQ